MNKHLLHHIIRQHAATNSAAIAVSAGATQLSYAALDASSNQLAHALLQAGLRRGDRVGVYMSAAAEYIIAVTAVMKAGGIFLPLDAAYPHNRISSFIAEANPGILITLDHLYDACLDCCDEEHHPVVYTIRYEQELFSVQNPADKEIYNALPLTDPDTTLDGEDGNYLLFTSGSTGTPKGIEGRHKSLSHFVHWEMKQFGLGADTRISLLAPITFDVSLRDIFVPLAAGGTVCIPGEKEKQEPGHFLQWVHSEGITLIHCVPSFLRLLIATLQDMPALKDTLLTVKHILVAGEPLYGKDVNAWKAVAGAQPALVNLYGPSETTLAKLFFPVNGKPFADGAIIPLGQPVANTVALVVKEQALCATGEEGEIMIKTPFMTRGYYNNELLNKEKFIQNPLHNDFDDIVFRTGDLGYYDDDNLIHFTGRADDMIKFNGNRIELAELQKTALQYPDIREAVALVRKDAGEQEQLVLFFTATQTVSIPALQQHFGLQLPGYMHPTMFVQAEQFPVNPNGKTDKAALAAMELAPVSSGEALTDETEIAIGQIWKELLKIGDITRDLSFFQAGGSSLKAIQMISKIYKQKGVLLNVREIMAHPTVPGIKTLIMDKLGATAAPAETKAAAATTGISVTQQQVLQWAATEDQWIDFNMPYGYVINGRLDTVLLEKAVHTLTDQYTFFRKGFRNRGGQWENVAVTSTPDYAVIDAKGKTAAALDAQLLLLAREPFIKEGKPLARFRLLVTGDNQYLFLFMTHLAVSDGVTAQGWVKELWEIYQGMLTGTPYMVNTSITDNTALLSREQQAGGTHAEYRKGIYNTQTTSKWFPAGDTFSSNQLSSHSFTISNADCQTWNPALAATGTTLQFFLLAAAERTIAAILGEELFTYHAVISDRGNYAPGMAANLLYYVPFTVKTIPPAATHLLRVKDNLLAAMDHLPLPLNVPAARPGIVINIVPVQEVDENTPAGVAISPYTGVIHRERFPVNIAVLLSGDGVHISVDHILSNVNFGAGFETAFRQAVTILGTVQNPPQS